MAKGEGEKEMTHDEIAKIWAALEQHQQSFNALVATTKRILGMPYVDPQMNEPIDNLNLHTRSRNCLLAENVYYIGDLVSTSKAELSKFYSLGKFSLADIERSLSERGLRLGEPPEKCGRGLFNKGESK